MFSISSASSITTFWMVERETVLRSMRSSRRPGSGHYDMHTAFQGTYLAFNGRTAIYGQYPQSVNVFGIVIQVSCYLQRQSSRVGQRISDWGIPVFNVNLLYKRQTECGCFSCSCLCQCYYIIIFLPKGTELLLLVPAWDTHIPFLQLLYVSPEKRQALQMSSLNLCISFISAAKIVNLVDNE